MSIKAKMRHGVLALVLAVSACGWAEWPPPGSEPPLMSRAVPAPRVTDGARLFMGASAVVVGKGDTVYALSRRHRVSVRAIIEANGLRPPYLLSIGQRIKLPRVREHVVARGETLSGIARRYNVGPYTLARANDIAAPYTIGVGQRLRLPGAQVRKIQSQARLKKPGKAKTRVVARVRPPAAAAPRPPARSGRGFAWPVKGRVISRFGPKAKGLQNDGINIAAPRGTPVRAAENGVVAYAGNELRGFGNLLLIKHSGGWITAYAHNERLLVKRGEKVRKGQGIATVGSSGSVDRPQLHFELRRGMRATDPSKYLQG